jgi:hypothetical protein
VGKDVNKQKGQPLSQDGWPLYFAFRVGIHLTPIVLPDLRALLKKTKNNNNLLMRWLRARATQRTASPIFNSGDRATHRQNHRMTAGHQTSDTRFPALLDHVYGGYQGSYHRKSQNKQGEGGEQFAHKVQLECGYAAQKEPHVLAAKVLHAV